MKAILVCALFVVYAGSFLASCEDYKGALAASLLFYEAQRTGKLPPDNRIPWRGDSMMNDKGDNGLDLTGGYFDAGDFVKFGFPAANAMTTLAWGLIDYKAGYDKAGQTTRGLATIKWATDYFLKCHPSPNVFYAQVGNGDIDHAYWGRPEDFTGARPAYKVDEQHPGSDVAGETAAALAAASMAFNARGGRPNRAYAANLINHAKQLYAFADRFRGKYSDVIPDAKKFYASTSYGDELAWAAIWLYRATGEKTYLDQAKKHYDDNGIAYYSAYGWDTKNAGVQVLLAKLTGEQKYKDVIEKYCNGITWGTKKTPKGLIFLGQWGSLRNVANAAFICMQAGDLNIKLDDYYNMARSQIDYALGSTGKSFVVGFGRNPPVRPHHRASSCPARPQRCDYNSPGLNTATPNVHVLTGALVGGPDENDQHHDTRGDAVQNEVALDYNAAYTSALAGLAQRYQ